jgi:hypothetical protein
MSRVDYIDSLWTFELENIPSPSPDDKKKVFAYKKFKGDLLNSEKREDQKSAIQREAVSEIYQLIGFDSVFQAVWFQAVVALAQTHVSCRASALLVTASVLVSFGTIVGVYFKFDKIYKAKDGFHKDKLHSSVVQRHIKLFEEKGLGVDWDEIQLSDPSPILDEDFREKLVKLNQTKVGILIFFTILSVLFAWLLHAVMCNKYP